MKKVKRQYTKWEKIFAKQIFDKGLIFRKCKVLSQLNSKKDNLIWKGKEFGYSSKEDIQMANKHTKKMLNTI
jgi:hypothetical protein